MNTSPKTLESVLDTISPILLGEMDSIKLMNRIDSKFLTTEATLVHVLEDASARGYRALETEGTKISAYDTLYYDTPGLQMFLDHHNRRLVRQKVRTRTYVGSGQTFLEIKRKNNHGRTKKKRIEVNDMDLHDEEKRLFIEQHLHFDVDKLIPHMHNHFHRITLVNRAKTERLTIDTDLQFHNVQTDTDRHMGDLVIIELKRDGLVYSPVLEMLRQLRIHPHGFSKYCMGAAMTNDSLPVNLFKTKLRDVEKILKEAI